MSTTKSVEALEENYGTKVNKQMRDELYIETLSIYTLDLEIFITFSCYCDNMRLMCWLPAALYNFQFDLRLDAISREKICRWCNFGNVVHIEHH